MLDWLSIAQKNLKAKNNKKFVELDVQRLIIEPLLQWLGYDTFDFDVVKEQVSIKNSGQKAGQGRADYTISHNGTIIMIIEAKALSESLESIHVKQVLDYCNYHKDRPRWGILTNGLDWQIYDTEARGEIAERCILQINVEEDLDVLKCLRLENITTLKEYADNMRALLNVPKEQRGTFTGFAYKDFLSKLQTESKPQKEPKKTSPKPKKTVSIPNTAIASYNSPPDSGTKPKHIIINNQKFETKHWSNVLQTFVLKLVEIIPNPQELDGWSHGKAKVVISKDKNSLIYPKALGHGLFISTNYNTRDIIRIIDTLIDKYNWNKDCYWVE